MKDLIYRQDAIDAIDVKNVNKGIVSALQSIIEELPSAQPENDMIRLQKEQAYLKCWEEGREALRRAAIDAVEKESQVDNAYGYMDTKSIIDLLSDLPSAQQLTLTCDGCRHVGTYDTDFPCSGCIRREKDYYEQER